MKSLKATQTYFKKVIEKLETSNEEYSFFPKYNKVFRQRCNLLKLATKEEQEGIMKVFLYPNQDNIVINKVFFHIDEYREMLNISQK